MSTDASSDEMIRVYSTLWAIRSNLEGQDMVPRDLGKEYDRLITRASKALKTDLGEFTIGDAYLSPNQQYQDPVMLRIRADSALAYLRGIMPPDKIQQIGPGS